MDANKASSSLSKKGLTGRVFGGLKQKKNAALLALSILAGGSSYASEGPKQTETPNEKKESPALLLRTADRSSSVLEAQQDSGFIRKPLNQTQTEPLKLPELGETKKDNNGFDINPSASGVSVTGVVGQTNFKTGVNYSGFMGATANLGFSTMLTESAAIFVELRGGPKETEVFTRFATKVPGTDKDLFALTLSDLRQLREFNFGDGAEKQRVERVLAGATYRTQGGTFIKHMDISAYFANTPSYNLGVRETIVDTPALYQEFTEKKRLAGGSVTGLSITPSIDLTDSFNVQATVGAERIKTDYTNKNHPTAIDAVKNTLAYNLKGTYKIDKTSDISVAYGESGNTQRLTVGTRINNIVSVDAYKTRSTNGGQSDHGVRVSMNIPLGKDKMGASSISLNGNKVTTKSYSPVNNPVINFAEQRPEFAVANIINIKIDPTVAKILNINIDKTGIPKGASIDKTTGDISLALDTATVVDFGQLVDAVNQNNGMVVPTGAITLNGGSLVIRTGLLKSALAGSSEANPHTIVVRFKNGQSIVIKAFEGSVHIVEITTEYPTVLTTPTISDISVNSFTVAGGIVDKDGVSSIRYYVYSSNPATDKDAKILTSVNAAETGATQITVGSVDTASVFVRASGLAKQGGKLMPVDSPVSEVKLLKPVTPGVPNCLGDDTTNTINCAPGTDITKLEYSTDGGKTYVQFAKDLKFPGVQTVLVQEKAAGINPTGKTTELKFTNSAPVTSTDPIKIKIGSGSTTTIPAPSVTDADGDQLQYILSAVGNTGIPAQITIAAN